MDEPHDKRTMILDAAIALLGEEGLGAFSQQRVAARLGLRQGHITYYYPTRADLLKAVATRALAQRAEQLRNVLDGSNEQEKIFTFTAVLADPARTRVLAALTQTADSDPGVRAAFGDFAAELAPISAALLTSLGITPTPQNVPLVQATATGIAVLMLAISPPDAHERARELMTTLLTSLRGAQAAIGENRS